MVTICMWFSYVIIGASYFHYAHFGEGDGPILMSYVDCYSPSDSLLDCYIRYRYNIRYNHNYDVGVRCQREHAFFHILFHYGLSFTSLL